MNKTNAPILSVSGLKKDFDMPGGGRLALLKGVDFELGAGQMAFIVGRSGSGKSTLLHLVGALDEPTAGKILFDGQDLTRWREPELARYRNRHIGFVFQFFHLLPELTVYQNILLPTMIAGRPDASWVKEILRQVKLLSRKDYYPSELSGGEKQRVAIARALANKPSIVFCDEPTGNLDEETAESVFSLIDDLNREQGQTFMIVTHDESLAWRYPQGVFRLHDGMLRHEERGRDPGSVETKQMP